MKTLTSRTVLMLTMGLVFFGGLACGDSDDNPSSDGGEASDPGHESDVDAKDGNNDDTMDGDDGAGNDGVGNDDGVGANAQTPDKEPASDGTTNGDSDGSVQGDSAAKTSDTGQPDTLQPDNVDSESQGMGTDTGQSSDPTDSFETDDTGSATIDSDTVEIDTGPWKIPAGCEFIGVLDTDESNRCWGPPERCDQMEKDGRAHGFICSIDGPEAEMEKREACVAQAIEENGGTVRSILTTLHFVTAKGNWRVLSPLQAAKDVKCEPNCDGGTCNYCWELDETACTADPFCVDMTARKIDMVDECYYPEEAWWCSPMSICGAALSAAEDSEGNCYTFPTTCHPPGMTGIDYMDCVDSGLSTCSDS